MSLGPYGFVVICTEYDAQVAMALDTLAGEVFP
jgi:hypothetical protein